jgi:hypothetical protein
MRRFSRKTQLVDSDRTDTESATPTATTHPTPRAKSKSKMESVVQEPGLAFGWLSLEVLSVRLDEVKGVEPSGEECGTSRGLGGEYMA